MPWRRFLEIGLGVLHMRAEDFWNLSLYEFYAACDGLNEFNSGGKKHTPLTRSELDELMEMYPD